ncbi:tryptophan synthase subunit alpha [Candidatus Bathyarchaeota archaeon]|nr:tryptophan synthase subunit alpha [Candidatus Bathyarchaeota archaeon]
MQGTYPNNGLISTKLDELRSRNEGALVAYLTGGDPSPDRFLTNAAALIKGGTDIVEVGIPFSDPIADGPVIQAASQRALNQGITPRRVLSLVRELSRQHDLPFVILTYYNPILAMGVERFLRMAKKSGVDGIVVPDLPAQHDRAFQEQTMKHGIDRILLAAPNTDQRRLRQILAETSGFLYLVSLYGVTGPRRVLGDSASKSLDRIRSLNGHKTPVLAGFGVSTPSQVKELLRAGADGAIVGSALVQMTQDHMHDENGAERRLRRRVAELKAATRPRPRAA